MADAGTHGNPNELKRRTWDEFRDCGLLWWVNRGLHLFGWAIVCKYENHKLQEVYPARCPFRGFDSKAEETGFESLTTHLSENIDQLKSDVYETE